MGIFERLLCLGSLKCFGVFIVYQHVILLVLKGGGIRLIFLEVIVLIVYLGSWALMIIIIILKFLLNFHLLKLKLIGCEQFRAFPFLGFFFRGLHHASPLLSSWLREAQITFKKVF